MGGAKGFGFSPGFTAVEFLLYWDDLGAERKLSTVIMRVPKVGMTLLTHWRASFAAF